MHQSLDNVHIADYSLNTSEGVDRRFSLIMARIRNSDPDQLQEFMDRELTSILKVIKVTINHNRANPLRPTTEDLDILIGNLSKMKDIDLWVERSCRLFVGILDRQSLIYLYEVLTDPESEPQFFIRARFLTYIASSRQAPIEICEELQKTTCMTEWVRRLSPDPAIAQKSVSAIHRSAICTLTEQHRRQQLLDYIEAIDQYSPFAAFEIIDRSIIPFLIYSNSTQVRNYMKRFILTEPQLELLVEKTSAIYPNLNVSGQESVARLMYFLVECISPDTLTRLGHVASDSDIDIPEAIRCSIPRSGHEDYYFIEYPIEPRTDLKD